MTMTIFPDQLFANRGTQGQQGNGIFLKPVTGGGDGQRGDAPIRAVKTLTHAQAAASADQNDRVYMFAQGNTGSDTTDYQSTSLLWAKDGVHLIGVNAGPVYSQRSRIANVSGTSATVGTALAALVTLSANGCLFENIGMFQGYGHANAVGCLHVSGDRNVIRNCHIAGMGIAASAGAAGGYSLKVTGSENLFEDCTIGLDTIARTTTNSEILFAANATTGLGATRNHFRRCRIVSYCTGSGSGHTWVKAATNTLDRSTIFEDCVFVNYPSVSAGVAMTGGFSLAAGTGGPDGMVVLYNCLLIGCTNDEASTSGRLFKGISNSTSFTQVGATTQI